MTSDQKENIEFAARSGAKQLFLRYGIGFLINVAGTIVIARKGGPELWGVFAVSQLVLTIFAVLSHGCWGYLIQSPTAPDKLEIGNCYSFQTIVSVSWAVIILALSPLLADRLSTKALFPLLPATVFGGLFYGWRYVTCALSERNLRYGVAAAAELSDILVFNVIAVALTVAGYPYHGIVAGNVLRGVVSTLIAQKRARQKLYFHLDKNVMKRVVKFSVPYTSFIALQWLPIYAGPVVAGSFLGIRELGVLQLAYKTVEYPRVLVTIAFRLSMSIFSRTGKTVEEVRQGLKKILDILFFVLIHAMSMIVAMSPAWIPFVYGTAWMQMSNVMIIIVFPHLTMAMMMIVSSLMSARGNAKTSFLFYGIYNIAYWIALVIMTYKLGFLALPLTEWIALAGCIILIRAIQVSGIGTNIVFKYLGVLFTASLGAALLWHIALHRTLTETLIAGIIMTCLWFLLSPARKEIVTWVKQHHALDAEYKAVSAKSKK